jgi:hypothetical protein
MSQMVAVSGSIEIKVPRSVLSSITHCDDDGSQWAWPHGSGAIASLRSLVRRGLASETTGECEGCRSHRAGTNVPVFHIFDGVDLRAR